MGELVEISKGDLRRALEGFDLLQCSVCGSNEDLLIHGPFTDCHCDLPTEHHPYWSYLDKVWSTLTGEYVLAE